MNTQPAPVLPGSATYGQFSHRLQSVGATPRTYDAVGNTLTGIPAITAQNAQAEYDVRNRLTSLRMGANDYIARYHHNGRGERVAKQVGTDGFLYLYDESGQLLGRYRTNAAPGTTWTPDEELIWLDNTPVASVRIEGGQPIVRAILTDHLNTPRALSALHGGNQPPGTVVWKWSLTSPDATGNNAFGTAAPNEDPDANGTAVSFDMRFPGQYRDNESGLHYNYFRDYEPGTGRYVESDPIGLMGGMNMFAYVDGMPLLRIDEYGLLGRQYPPSPRTRAYESLKRTYYEMKRKNVGGTDQFFHCLAACRAVQLTGSKSIVMELMDDKEDLDRDLNFVGLYGNRRLDAWEMGEDNANDRIVNDFGASCPPDVECSAYCSKYLDRLPEHKRKYMTDYRTEW